MPRKRRAGKVQRQALDAGLWRYLCDLPEPGDAESEAVAACRFFGDPWTEEQAWALYGAEATVAHAVVHPGCRPLMWWRIDAPEAPQACREKVGGFGRIVGAGNYGLPILLGVNRADPPVIESEAGYLRRHALLAPAELRRLRPEDFAPVEIIDDNDQLAGDCEDGE
jgi:hypothetical protein